MCMKNVNATMFMCSSVVVGDNNSLAISGLYDNVVPKKEEDGRLFIDNFNIVLNASIIFGSHADLSDDYFKLDEEYEFLIRLTHADSSKGATLDEFVLKLNKSQLRTWCKDFYEFTRIVKIQKLYIPRGMGKYALKLYVRPKTDTENAPWRTQTIHALIVGGVQSA